MMGGHRARACEFSEEWGTDQFSSASPHKLLLVGEEELNRGGPLQPLSYIYPYIYMKEADRILKQWDKKQHQRRCATVKSICSLYPRQRVIPLIYK